MVLELANLTAVLIIAVNNTVMGTETIETQFE
jgi:hypothetical protein